MDTLLAKLQTHFPALSFQPGVRFSWSPANRHIIYNETANKDDEAAVWALLHEVGHALLDHNRYSSDFELVSMELAAWEQAEKLAKKYDYNINPGHIQDCLDTYRDWLYQRSTCPTCTSCSLQIDDRTYCCFNCGSTWQVSRSRLCRAYRRKQKEILV